MHFIHHSIAGAHLSCTSQPTDNTTTSQGRTFADLPPELIHEIFRAGAISSTHFCTTLSLVSSWTRKLALRQLLSTIVIKDNNTSVKFCQYLSKPKNSPPIPGYANRAHLVQSVWFETASYHIVDILFVCNHLTHIAVSKEGFDWLRRYSGGWDQSGMKNVTRSVEVERELQMLLLLKKSQLNSWTNSGHIHHPAPIYRQITHLRLSDCGSYAANKLNLQLFPRLSKFAVPFYDAAVHNLDELWTTVEDHQGLEVLVIVMLEDLISEADRNAAVKWVGEKRKGASTSSLPKIYIMESTSTEIQEEWEGEVRAGCSVWDRARIWTEDMLRESASKKQQPRSLPLLTLSSQSEAVTARHSSCFQLPSPSDVAAALSGLPAWYYAGHRQPSVMQLSSL